jgi:hypothetical protein
MTLLFLFYSQSYPVAALDTYNVVSSDAVLPPKHPRVQQPNKTIPRVLLNLLFLRLCDLFGCNLNSTLNATHYFLTNLAVALLPIATILRIHDFSVDR